MRLSPETGFDIGILSLEGEDPFGGGPLEAELFLETPFTEAFPKFSPDGRWIAYMSDESGRYEIYIQPYPGPGGKVQVSTNGGEKALWNPNGRELFYRLGSQFYGVDVTLGAEPVVGKPRILFDGPFPNIPGYSHDIAPDGQRFLVAEEPGYFRALTELIVITNFFDELRRRDPHGAPQ
jgi:hypothetical protein